MLAVYACLPQAGIVTLNSLFAEIDQNSADHVFAEVHLHNNKEMLLAFAYGDYVAEYNTGVRAFSSSSDTDGQK